MAITREYLEFIAEQLNRIRPVTARRMFGGAGFYADGVIFAVADDESIFFKVDDASRAEYEMLGRRPFQPTEGMVSRNYYELPDGVMEDAEALLPWVKKAVLASRAVTKKKRRDG